MVSLSEKCHNYDYVCCYPFREKISWLNFRKWNLWVFCRIGKHVGEFESMFLSDLDSGQLSIKNSYCGLEGEISYVICHFSFDSICLEVVGEILGTIFLFEHFAISFLFHTVSFAAPPLFNLCLKLVFIFLNDELVIFFSAGLLLLYESFLLTLLYYLL